MIQKPQWTLSCPFHLNLQFFSNKQNSQMTNHRKWWWPLIISTQKYQISFPSKHKTSSVHVVMGCYPGVDDVLKDDRVNVWNEKFILLNFTFGAHCIYFVLQTLHISTVYICIYIYLISVREKCISVENLLLSVCLSVLIWFYIR